MKKIFLLAFLGFWQSGFAQTLPVSPTANLPQLRRLSDERQKFFINNYRQALKLAQTHHWTVRQVMPDGRIMALQGIDEVGMPVYKITDNNTDAAATTSTDQLWAGGSLGLNLTGGLPALQNKLGIWDGAAVRATHQELTGRVTQKDAGTTVDAGTGANHATHVSGTMIGKGINPVARGMANAANLQAYDFGNDNTEMAAAAPNLLVSNHSYGRVSGWSYNSTRLGTATDPFWEWYGNPNIDANEDYAFGFYDSDTQFWDQIAYNAPSYLIVKSAGNNRSSTGPAAGSPYWQITGNSRTLVTSRPAAMSSNNAYDIISTYGVAKNILTVGAVLPIRPGYSTASQVKQTSFSSWGPTDDGRIKPDISADGSNLLSSWATADNAYGVISGTSMATPNVSGSLFLLQEHYANLNNGQFMRAATLKGLAIHTANEAGTTPGPDYTFGWGLLNAKGAAQVISGNNQNHVLQEKTLAQGQIYTFTVVASGEGNLKATICWTDPEASPTSISAANLNNRTPKLINDLDIRISDGTTEFLPWTLDPANPANPATPGDNIRDNVEQIRVANTVPGKTYTVTVRHKGTLQRGPQAYSLLVSGIGGTAYCASSGSQPSGNGYMASVQIGSFTQNSPSNCQPYSDYTSTPVSLPFVRQGVPLSVSLADCSGNADKIVKIFVDYNRNGNFTDVGENVITSSPVNGSNTLLINLILPGDLTVGNLYRMRLVCATTSNPNSVTPCGTYPNGETEDYTLLFTRPVKDVGVADLLFPENSFCPGPTQPVAVLLRNAGMDTLRNIPVTVSIKNGNTLVKKIDNVMPVSSFIAPLENYRLALDQTFNALPGTAYTFEISTTLAADEDLSNNSGTFTRLASSPATVSGSALVCGNEGFLSAADNVSWYDALTGGSFLGASNYLTTNVLPSNQTYFVSPGEYQGSFGASGKSAFSGGTYGGNFGPQPVFKTEVPVVLENAKLYIGSAGKIVCTLRTANDDWVQSVTLDVVPTRNPPGNAANGTQLPDDLTDAGAVYPLNLIFPKPGEYKIVVECKDGASIFRSNQGVSSFPYTLPGIVSNKGAFFINNSLVDTLKAAYYFFYDMKIRTLCQSQRSPVVATVKTDLAPTATVSGGNTTAFCEGKGSAAINFALTGTPPWNLTYTDGKKNTTVSNITASPYTLNATTAGVFQVTGLADAKSCNRFKASGSAAVLVTPNPQATITIANGYELTASGGVLFKWLLNGQVIPATNQKYIATAIGKYKVEVTNTAGCVSVSPEVDVSVAATEPGVNTKEIRLSPNPATERVWVQFPAGEISQIRLQNALGQQVKSFEIPKNISTYELNLSSFSAGMYLVMMEGRSGKVVRKVVKQ
jgi:hypothetical protein